MEPEVTTVSTYGRSGSSARVRVYDWLDHLDLRARTHAYVDTADNRPGTLVRHLPSLLRAERRLRALVDHVDGVPLVMSRRASPFSRGAIEERLLRAGSPGVYDFDDALHLPGTGLVDGVLEPHDRWRRSVAAADVVIAGNDWLGEVASEHSREVVVIPSCVEMSAYERKASYERPGPPRAVWLGSPSTERYLLHIADALLAANAVTGMQLTVVSAGAASLGELDGIVTRRPWALSTFASILAESDFGIMPLDDDPFARGKCAYKLLQYGAAGLPMIGSPVGANDLALSRTGGLAPRTSEAWLEALVSMARVAPSTAQELGRRAHAAVEQHYSFAAWRSAWTEAIGISERA